MHFRLHKGEESRLTEAPGLSSLPFPINFEPGGPSEHIPGGPFMWCRTAFSLQLPPAACRVADARTLNGMPGLPC